MAFPPASADDYLVGKDPSAVGAGAGLDADVAGGDRGTGRSSDRSTGYIGGTGRTAAGMPPVSNEGYAVIADHLAGNAPQFHKTNPVRRGGDHHLRGQEDLRAADLHEVQLHRAHILHPAQVHGHIEPPPGEPYPLLRHTWSYKAHCR